MPKSKTQTITLDKTGKILCSKGDLFPSNIITSDSFRVFEHFPLLESVFHTIINLPLNAPPVHIPGIELESKLLKGTFDFSLEKDMNAHRTTLVWNIYDRSSYYKELKEIQQNEHNWDINQQKRIIKREKSNK